MEAKKEILHLLQERNNCLVQFSDVNKRALVKFKKYDYEDINSFYTVREGLLDMISKIEVVVTKKVGKDDLFKFDLTTNFKESVDGLLKEKDHIVKEILDQDLEIMSLIEREKTRIYHNIHRLRKGRKSISAYKSGEQDSRLNEEV